jgi:tripartite ATP-independent transporter DctP family solute receptor
MAFRAYKKYVSGLSSNWWCRDVRLKWQRLFTSLVKMNENRRRRVKLVDQAKKEEIMSDFDKNTVGQAALTFSEPRRSFLKKIAGVAAVGAAPAAIMSPAVLLAADEPQFKLKLGISLADTHSIPKGLKLATADILRESQGKLSIEVFANSQLGSDTDMMSQVRSGGLDMFTTAGQVWGGLMPVASITATAFAFADYKTVWSAVDGELGAHIRSGFSRFGLVPMGKAYDHGFRQITTSARPILTPQDLSGLKIRVPASPIIVSLFRLIGAAPVSMPYAEAYTALQTKVADGQENPLGVVETAKFYEVQKYCSLTSHAWDGFWLVANKRAWDKIPENLREMAMRIFDENADKQRAENAALETSLITSLAGRGVAFNKVDRDPFIKAMKSNTYYTDWKEKIGPEAWSILEKYTGPLA